jgi:hypothetical protein
MRWYFNKYCIKYSNIALFTHMRWKIQLYRIIYAHALENTIISHYYAHALENTVISHYLSTCAGKYSYITLCTHMRW